MILILFVVSLICRKYGAIGMFRMFSFLTQSLCTRFNLHLGAIPGDGCVFWDAEIYEASFFVGTSYGHQKIGATHIAHGHAGRRRWPVNILATVSRPSRIRIELMQTSEIIASDRIECGSSHHSNDDSVRFSSFWNGTNHRIHRSTLWFVRLFTWMRSFESLIIAQQITTIYAYYAQRKVSNAENQRTHHCCNFHICIFRNVGSE